MMSLVSFMGRVASGSVNCRVESVKCRVSGVGCQVSKVHKRGAGNKESELLTLNSERTIALFGCREQYEPASFVVTASKQLEAVRVEVGRLSGEGGTFGELRDLLPLHRCRRGDGSCHSR